MNLEEVKNNTKKKVTRSYKKRESLDRDFILNHWSELEELRDANVSYDLIKKYFDREYKREISYGWIRKVYLSVKEPNHGR